MEPPAYYLVMKQVKSFLPIALSIIFLWLSGCGTDNKNYDRMRIEQVLYEVKRAYNMHDIDKLMFNFHYDFLHNGMYKNQVRDLWLDRMAEWQDMDYYQVEIEINGEHAVVSFRLRFESPGDIQFYNEPQDNGDLSYFYYAYGDWRIYGNQKFY